MKTVRLLPIPLSEVKRAQVPNFGPNKLADKTQNRTASHEPCGQSPHIKVDIRYRLLLFQHAAACSSCYMCEAAEVCMSKELDKVP
ncbi:unnamed protein product [Leptosia nina]|uniref:Uncharacterized protein n=1 Tax=Leptosia nina TaxID=320188 RepID=A0AAV1IZ78_9NEOP